MGSNIFGKLAGRERIRNEVLSKSDLMPSLPDTVYRVMELLNDPSAEILECEKILRTDTTLVARMLKVVNSPLYGRAKRITSIKDAVMTLGFRSLRGIILAASTGKYLKMDFACYGFKEKGLWLHSLAVAAGAKSLSKLMGNSLAETEEAFVAGLLHDIGKILLGPYLTKMGIQIDCRESPITETEQTYLGINHEEAGAKLAEKWNLGEMVKTVIKEHHHKPLLTELPRIIAKVKIGNILAYSLGFGLGSRRPLNKKCLEKCLEVLGIERSDWENEIQSEVEESMRDALSILAGTA